jgi:hypothetical protein
VTEHMQRITEVREQRCIQRSGQSSAMPMSLAQWDPFAQNIARTTLRVLWQQICEAAPKKAQAVLQDARTEVRWQRAGPRNINMHAESAGLSRPEWACCARRLRARTRPGP